MQIQRICLAKTNLSEEQRNRESVDSRHKSNKRKSTWPVCFWRGKGGIVLQVLDLLRCKNKNYLMIKKILGIQGKKTLVWLNWTGDIINKTPSGQQKSHYTSKYTPNIQIHPLQNNINVSKVHCGSAFQPGASEIPYYCTSICVRSWCYWRGNCVDLKTKQKKHSGHPQMNQLFTFWYW